MMQLERLMAPFDDRGRYILTSRYGLDQRPVRSLRMIASDLSLSAERVRQIEHGLLGELARQLSREALDALIADMRDAAWRSISIGEGFLRRRDLGRRRGGLPHDFRLLLAISGLSITDWLNRSCQPIGHGWTSIDISPDRIADIVRQIEQRLTHRRTVSIAHVGEGLDLDEIRIAAALILDLPIRYGRIGGSRPGQCRRFNSAGWRATARRQI